MQGTTRSAEMTNLQPDTLCWLLQGQLRYFLCDFYPLASVFFAERERERKGRGGGGSKREREKEREREIERGRGERERGRERGGGGGAL